MKTYLIVGLSTLYGYNIQYANDYSVWLVSLVSIFVGALIGAVASELED